MSVNPKNDLCECTQWAYDPVTMSNWNFAKNAHHPDCPKNTSSTQYGFSKAYSSHMYGPFPEIRAALDAAEKLVKEKQAESVIEFGTCKFSSEIKLEFMKMEHFITQLASIESTSFELVGPPEKAERHLRSLLSQWASKWLKPTNWVLEIKETGTVDQLREKLLVES